MTTIPFCKFHGFGNDYIVIERESVREDVGELAKAICHRHTGAGADGIAAIGPDTEADFFCEIVNPDGSIAGFPATAPAARSLIFITKNSGRNRH